VVIENQESTNKTCQPVSSMWLNDLNIKNKTAQGEALAAEKRAEQLVFP
jgi:hypothetical protein